MYAFISYAHKDKKTVINSIKALESEGFNIWYDKGIKAGDDWAQKIGNSLLDASVMVLFLSKNSIKSKNVLREIEFAEEHQIQIITVRIGNPKLNEDIERRLYVNQVVDLYSFKTYNDFAKEIGIVLEKYIERHERFELKRIKIKKGGYAKWIVLGIIAVIIAYFGISKFLLANVPYVVGMLPENGKLSVEDAGYKCNIAQDYSEDVEYGYIFKQSESGKTLKTHPIVITQSLGPNSDITDIPGTIGLHISDGVKLLIEAGITKFTVKPVKSNQFSISYISNQSIPAGFKVSKKNPFTIDVVADKAGIKLSYNNKTYTLSGEDKTSVELSEDGALVLNNIKMLEFNVDYKEVIPVDDSKVDAAVIFNSSLIGDTVGTIGKYKGEISFGINVDISKADAVLWKTLRSALADENGMVSMNVQSNDFSFTLQEYDETLLKNFVSDITGSVDDLEIESNPVSMATGAGFNISDTSGVSGLLKYSDALSEMLNMSIPKLEGNYVSQPYYIVFYKNGKGKISFVSEKGDDKVMTMSGDIISITLDE